MAETKSFCAVEFNHENLSAIVPSKWLKSRKVKKSDSGEVTSGKCYWPKDSRRVNALVRKQADPNPKTWDLFDVIILQEYDSYEEGRKALASEFTDGPTVEEPDGSCSDEDESRAARLKRRKKAVSPSRRRASESSVDESLPSVDILQSNEKSVDDIVMETSQRLERMDSFYEPSQRISVSPVKSIKSPKRRVGESPLKSIQSQNKRIVMSPVKSIPSPNKRIVVSPVKSIQSQNKRIVVSPVKSIQSPNKRIVVSPVKSIQSQNKRIVVSPVKSVKSPKRGSSGSISKTPTRIQEGNSVLTFPASTPRKKVTEKNRTPSASASKDGTKRKDTPRKESPADTGKQKSNSKHTKQTAIRSYLDTCQAKTSNVSELDGIDFLDDDVNFDYPELDQLSCAESTPTNNGSEDGMFKTPNSAPSSAKRGLSFTSSQQNSSVDGVKLLMRSLQSDVQVMKEEIKTITVSVNRVLSCVLPPLDNSISDELPELPLDNEKKEKDFERLLQKPEKFHKTVSFIYGLGGGNPKDAVYLAMRTMYSDRLASTKSLRGIQRTGKEKKTAFMGTLPFKAVMSAVRKRFKDATVFEVCEIIGTWLKDAPAREKKRASRKSAAEARLRNLEYNEESALESE